MSMILFSFYITSELSTIAGHFWHLINYVRDGKFYQFCLKKKTLYFGTNQT